MKYWIQWSLGLTAYSYILQVEKQESRRESRRERLKEKTQVQESEEMIR